MQPKVIITIVNWNGKEDTCDCIDSLKKLDYKNYEIAIVDNGSSDGSPEYISERFPDLKIILNSKNLGVGEGHNTGIRYALGRGADYILVVDNNAIVDPNALSVLIDAAESDKKIAVVGGKVYYYKKNILNSAGGLVDRRNGITIARGYMQEDKGQFDKIEEVDWLQGVYFLLKVDIYKEIGFFDPDYFILCNDADLCFRAKQSGYKVVYVPKALAWHKAESTTFGSYESARYRYYHVRNRLIFIKKNMDERKRALFIALMEILRELFAYLKALRRPENFKYIQYIKAATCAIIDFILKRYGKGPEWLYK